MGKKKAGLCREIGVLYFAIQIFGKTETKLLACLKIMGRE